MLTHKFFKNKMKNAIVFILLAISGSCIFAAGNVPLNELSKRNGECRYSKPDGHKVYFLKGNIFYDSGPYFGSIENIDEGFYLLTKADSETIEDKNIRFYEKYLMVAKRLSSDKFELIMIMSGKPIFFCDYSKNPLKIPQ